MRRLRFLLLLVVGSLVCAALGYGAALTRASSSGADAAAVPAAPVTARVELRRLSLLGDRRAVTDGSPTRPRSRSGSTAPVPVVTRTPIPVGGRSGAGDVLVEVTGRPVIALPGRLPAYRDLVVGDTGPDVVQLEAGARRARATTPVSRPTPSPQQTAAAVAALYDALGYRPATAAGPDRRRYVVRHAPRRDVVDTAVLPMSEVAYVPTLPRRLDRFRARVGSAAPEAAGPAVRAPVWSCAST